MKREVWIDEEEDSRLDSLYVATEIVKEAARSSTPATNLTYLIEEVYKKLEELRKRQG